MGLNRIPLKNLIGRRLAPLDGRSVDQSVDRFEEIPMPFEYIKLVGPNMQTSTPWHDVHDRIHYYTNHQGMLYWDDYYLAFPNIMEDVLNEKRIVYDDIIFYMVDDVYVPEWLYNNKDLDPKIFKTIQNTEVRSVFVKRIGMDRLASELDEKVVEVDKYHGHEYALILLGGDNYLSMTNPSTGERHIEGVPSWCWTVREAIEFRKPPALQAIPVDESDGEDYYQQGDVVMWPSNAMSVKFFPKVIT